MSKIKSYITLPELLLDVSSDSNVKAGTCKSVSSSLFDNIQKYLDEGREVRIQGFGKFVLHKQKGKRTHAVNAINADNLILSPDTTKIWFVPSDDWKERHVMNSAVFPETLPEGTQISSRFFPMLIAKYGIERTRQLYGNRFDVVRKKYGYTE